MIKETVHTTHTTQPGKHELKEIKVEITQVPETTDPFSRVGRAETIIHRNVLWALGAGVVPIPLLDIFTVTGVQIKMLKELSDLYGMKFTKSIAQKLIGSLLSGLGSVGLGSAIGASLAKLIPAIGTTVGAVSVPIFAGAFTHATGRIFLMHFESGGTVLDFDPHAMRSYFKQEFERAKETVARLQTKEGEAAGATMP